MATMTEAREAREELRIMADDLVRQWYRDVVGVEVDPTYKEVSQAVELLEGHGVALVLQAYPALVERVRRDFRTIARWGGADIHWQIVLRDLKKSIQRGERLKKEAEDRQPGPDAVEEDSPAVERRWKPVWDRLGKDERSQIEARVQAAHPFVANVPSFYKRLCYLELANRQGQTTG